MKYQFKKMDKQSAAEICFTWKYPDEYTFYNMTEDPEDLDEFLDINNWDKYFTVFDNNEHIGFIMYSLAGRYVYIGLGLKPELTGKGLGTQFVQDTITFLNNKKELQGKNIRLKVAQFNKRAISVYKKLGFIEIDSFMQSTNGSTYPFIEMKLI